MCRRPLFPLSGAASHRNLCAQHSDVPPVCPNSMSLFYLVSHTFLPVHMLLLYSADPHFSHSFLHHVQTLSSLPPSILSALHFLSSTVDFRDRVVAYPKGLYTCYVSQGSRTHDCPAVSTSKGLRIKACITMPS